jgi:uncharacterized OsmC-like protein
MGSDSPRQILPKAIARADRKPVFSKFLQYIAIPLKGCYYFFNTIAKEGLNMLTTFKAQVKSLPEGLQVEADVRGFKILMDEPKELGGTDQGMNPVEALLCALGGCQVIVAKAFAASQNFTFDDVYVELEGDLDPDGFMGLADVRNGFQQIRYTMHFKTNESQEKCEAFMKFIESKCPVGDCLCNSVQFAGSRVVRD